ETLRPLKTGELLDRTFFYYRRHFVMFVGIAALPNLVALALQLSRVAVQTQGGLLSSMLISVVAIVIVLVASTFSHGATVIAVSNIQLGRDASIREAFTSIRSQLGELIIISLNVGVRVVI